METTPKRYLLYQRTGQVLFQKALLEGMNPVHPCQALARTLPAANGSSSGPAQVPRHKHTAQGNPAGDVFNQVCAEILCCSDYTELHLNRASSWGWWGQMARAICAHAAWRVSARPSTFLSFPAWRASPCHSSRSRVHTTPWPYVPAMARHASIPRPGKLRESQPGGNVNEQSIWLAVNLCSRVSRQNRYSLRNWNYKALLGSWESPTFLRSWYRRPFRPFFHPPALCLGSSTCKTSWKTPTTGRCWGIYQLKSSVQSRSNFTVIRGSQRFRKLHEKKQTLRSDWGSSSHFP